MPRFIVSACDDCADPLRYLERCGAKGGVGVVGPWRYAYARMRDNVWIFLSSEVIGTAAEAKGALFKIISKLGATGESKLSVDTTWRSSYDGTDLSRGEETVIQIIKSIVPSSGISALKKMATTVWIRWPDCFLCEEEGTVMHAAEFTDEHGDRWVEVTPQTLTWTDEPREFTVFIYLRASLQQCIRPVRMVCRRYPGFGPWATVDGTHMQLEHRNVFDAPTIDGQGVGSLHVRDVYLRTYVLEPEEYILK